MFTANPIGVPNLCLAFSGPPFWPIIFDTCRDIWNDFKRSTYVYDNYSDVSRRQMIDEWRLIFFFFQDWRDFKVGWKIKFV